LIQHLCAVALDYQGIFAGEDKIIAEVSASRR
jgi:hypothetical protein